MVKLNVFIARFCLFLFFAFSFLLCDAGCGCRFFTGSQSTRGRGQSQGNIQAISTRRSFRRYKQPRVIEKTDVVRERSLSRVSRRSRPGMVCSGGVCRVVPGPVDSLAPVKEPVPPKDSRSSKKLCLISLLGKPGAGKGVISGSCVEKLGCKVLSMGDTLRDEVKKGTDLGKKIKSNMEGGKLAPTDLVYSVAKKKIKEILATGAKLIVLDGYPRKKEGAELLMKLLEQEGLRDSFSVLTLDVPDEEVLKRLGNRFVCGDCRKVFNIPCDVCGGRLIRRKDDTKEIIQGRIKDYKEKSGELLDFYSRGAVRVDRISGLGSPDEVFGKFEKVVEKNCTLSAAGDVK